LGLDVHDAAAGQSLVFAPSIVVETPAYVLAWASGEYTEIPLGTTSAGTSLSLWHLPGGDATAMQGGADLVAFFEYYENTLGAYAFGDAAGSVAVRWGPGALGGMEHHPFWHIGEGSMSDATVHAHEAAHGWFGDGVRIACWEDFVLSEGTVSYLTARAIEAVQGTTAGDNIWVSYQARLDAAMASTNLKIAWPDTCGSVDILEDKLFSSIPYMKGAFFYRALEQRIGAAALDAALSSFFQANVGKAATMQQLLDHIASSSGYDPNACAQSWLRAEALPTATSCP
jgi:aminopeptidase N